MSGGPVTSDRVQRFIVEAEAAAAVDHPVIVKTLGVDIAADGRPFQILELVDGVSLKQLREARGRLDAAEVALIGAQLADALACAHAAGVIHRDVKPTNVLLQQAAPRVRLVDFGVAKRMGSAAPGLTVKGQLIGTPAYMAPEQISDELEVGPPADVYGLGVLLYEVACGRLPFEARGSALLAAHVVSPPTPLQQRAPELPESLSAILMRCLAKRPEARPSARTVCDVLEGGVRASTPLLLPPAGAGTTLPPAPRDRQAARDATTLDGDAPLDAPSVNGTPGSA